VIIIDSVKGSTFLRAMRLECAMCIAT